MNARSKSLSIDHASGSTEFLSLLGLACRHFQVQLPQVLDRAGLAAAVLEVPGTRIPIQQVRKAWLALEELANDPLIGLKLSARLEPGAFDLLDYLVQSASLVREACELFCRYLPLLANAGRVWLTEAGDSALLCHHAEGAVPAISELFVGSIVARLRLIAGPSLQIRSVGFAHATRGTEQEYRAVLQAPVLFGQVCDTVCFNRAALDGRPLTSDPKLAQILSRQAEAAVAQLTPIPRDPNDELREIALELVLSGNASIERMAERLGTTPRTLQRRLSEAGQSHRRLVEAVRVELLESALEQGDQTWRELAARLGYSTPGSLRRARDRWRQRKQSAT